MKSSIFHLARVSALTCALSLSAVSMAQVFNAKTIDFSGVAGNIQIRVAAVPSITVQAPKAGAGFKASVEGNVLKLELPSSASRVSSTSRNGNIINSAVGPGAVAIQNIPGNSSVQTGGSGVVWVDAPLGTIVVANGFVGSASITGDARQANVQVSSGEVRFARAQDARLRVQGAGSIHVTEASGSLDLDLPGAGSIEVEKGQVGKLTATLKGAGDIRFGGTAATARLQADGAGSIHVHRVLQKPVLINSGAGEIVVENGG